MDLEQRLHGEEMGGVEEGKTIIRICYVRKKSFLNKKGKEEKGAEEEKEKEEQEEEKEEEVAFFLGVVGFVFNPSIQKTKE